MTARTDKTIDIQDLPLEENLTAEEQEKVAGAGRQAFRPTFDALEARELMAVNILAGAVPGGVAVSTMATGQASPTVEMGDLALELDPELNVGPNFGEALRVTKLGGANATQGKWELITDGQAVTIDPAKITSDNPLVLSSPSDRLRFTPSTGNQVVAVEVTGTIVTSNAAGATSERPFAVTMSNRVKYEGASDASAIISIDGGKYTLVGDDKSDVVRLYDSTLGGKPLATFDFSKQLYDPSRPWVKVHDIEGVTRVNDMLYWTTSGGPDNDVIFATKLTENGSASTLTYVGKYTGLRNELANNVKDAQGTYILKDAQAEQALNGKTERGYNIEGIVMKPGANSTAAYIAFRAPVVGSNKEALLVEVTNFTSLFEKSGVKAAFGKLPIQLDLGGRGLRDIVWHEDWKAFVLIGGNAAVGEGQTKESLIYVWNGKVDQNGRGQVFVLSEEGKQGNLDPENKPMSYEALGQISGNLSDGTAVVQVISDDGGSAHGKEQKDFNNRYFYGQYFSVSSRLGKKAATGLAG